MKIHIGTNSSKMSAKRMMAIDQAIKEQSELQHTTGLISPNLLRVREHVDPAMPLLQIQSLKEHTTFGHTNGQKHTYFLINILYPVLLNTTNTGSMVVVEDGTQKCSGFTQNKDIS